MKLLADECCDASVVRALRRDGHDVLYAIETLQGTSDRDVLVRAFDEERILLTEDKDFGELVFRLRFPARGIILLRFDVDELAKKIERVRSVLEKGERLKNAFVVVESAKTRIRPLR